MRKNWGAGDAPKQDKPLDKPQVAEEVLIPADIARWALVGAASRADADGYAAGVADTHKAFAEQRPSLMKRVTQALTIPDDLPESERPAILRPRDPVTNPDVFDRAGQKLKDGGKKAKVKIGEAWAEKRKKREEKKRQAKKDKEVVS
jgi:hypothetical protein